MKRESPANELLITEESMRLRGTAGDVVGRQIGTLMAEYDRRGAIEQRASEQLERTSNHQMWSALVDILGDQ